MENDQISIPKLSVSDFVALTNQTLEYAYPSVILEGEVESFKVNQGKFVFFNLKDDGASVGCFMMVFNLHVALEDGMRVIVRAHPKLTQWGKFSLTIDAVRPSGEGSIKKSFDLLKAALEKEGLFAAERKRSLPLMPRRVGVVSSTQAAGYADFMKIADDRWGGVEFIVCHTQVQGVDAPKQIVAALGYLNQLAEPLDAIVVIRGGGSADDLAAFNDESLVRVVASSRVPVLAGIGHEVDTTLVDLAADMRAATPSNAAQILLPDRREITRKVKYLRESLGINLGRTVAQSTEYVRELLLRARQSCTMNIESAEQRVQVQRKLLRSYDPALVLKRGYAIMRGDVDVGKVLQIETNKQIIEAKVVNYEQK